MCSAFGDGFEHRLHVGGRARYDPQDFRDRGLLLQRLFGLIEQPDVVDRNGRLAGECLDQHDLIGRKQPRLAAKEKDASVGTPFSHQRNCQSRPAPLSDHVLPCIGKFRIE